MGNVECSFTVHAHDLLLPSCQAVAVTPPPPLPVQVDGP